MYRLFANGFAIASRTKHKRSKGSQSGERAICEDGREDASETG
jgi:hypothetical protein